MVKKRTKVRPRYAVRDIAIAGPAVSKFSIHCHKCNQSAVAIELHKNDTGRFSIVTKGFIGEVTTFVKDELVAKQLFDKIWTLAQTNVVARSFIRARDCPPYGAPARAAMR